MGKPSYKSSSLSRLITSDIGRGLFLVLALLVSMPAFANEGFNGFCQDGGASVVTVGMFSTNLVQLSVPGCTVTVNVHGGGLATIFKDNINTPLSNPFTASTTDGSFLFYAATGRYDINVFSLGVLNYTYTDVILYDQSATGQSFVSPIITGGINISGGSVVAGGSSSDAFISTTHSDRAEILQNPDFEGSSLLPPPGWIVSGSATVTYETVSPAPGKLQSIKIATTAQFAGIETLDFSSVFPGETYSITAMSKTDGVGTGNCHINFFDKNNNFLNLITTSTSSSTSWVQISGSGTVPANSDYGRVLCNNNSVTSSSVWFDQIRVIPTTNPSGSYTSPTFNATTGYQIAGAAPSNHFPLGNGTNYIDASLMPTAAGGTGVSVSTVSGHNYFGNNTGSAAAPNFVQPVAGDITPGANGQCIVTSGGVSQWGNCASSPQVNTTAVTVSANTASQQTAQSVTFSAGTFNTVGKTFTIEASGTFNNFANTSESVTYTLVVGGTNVAQLTFTPATTSPITALWTIHAICSIITTGTSSTGTCTSITGGQITPSSQSFNFFASLDGSPLGNLTTSYIISTAVTYSTASTANSLTSDHLVVIPNN